MTETGDMILAPGLVSTERAEDLILGFLEQLKGRAYVWQVFHFRFSGQISAGPCLSNAEMLTATLAHIREQSADLCQKLQTHGLELQGLRGFQFVDQDVLVFVPAQTEDQRVKGDALYRALTAGLGEKIAERFPMAGAQARLEKIIDHKLLSARRITALEQTLDDRRLLSLPLRRKRREAPLVLLVEDDRFTSSYTTKLLGSDFDIVQVRTGEDAILQYMDQAPDVVLMDIHLPGLSGQQTAEVIRRMDPEAYVIMISVDTATETVRAATINRIGAFLKKPFSKERLHAAIGRSPHVKPTPTAPATNLNSSWQV